MLPLGYVPQGPFPPLRSQCQNPVASPGSLEWTPSWFLGTIPNFLFRQEPSGREPHFSPHSSVCSLSSSDPKHPQSSGLLSPLVPGSSGLPPQPRAPPRPLHFMPARSLLWGNCLGVAGHDCAVRMAAQDDPDVPSDLAVPFFTLLVQILRPSLCGVLTSPLQVPSSLQTDSTCTFSLQPDALASPRLLASHSCRPLSGYAGLCSRFTFNSSPRNFLHALQNSLLSLHPPSMRGRCLWA